MKVSRIHLIALVLTGLAFQPLFAQEQPLKNLIEHKREWKYALYPSTLRMINLAQNPDYNEMVNGVEKLLIFTLDSATKADKSYREIVPVYTGLGFDEYASGYGGQMSLALLGKEKDNQSEFVGYVGQGDMVVAFYLRGTIKWQKIPTLIQALRQEEMMNFFDLNR